ncbi:MAG: lipopolysaccharide kinase InaA family protein [Halioglobus sp.]
MIARSRILRGDSWADALSERLKEGPGDGQSWMEQHTEVVKRDDHSSVGAMRLQDQYCFLKYYRSKSLLHRLLFRIGRGRGVASYDNALTLRAAGISVPEPLACLLIADGVMLLSEGITSAADLKTLWLQGQNDSQLQQLMLNAAHSLAALHAAGFSHGDCKWSNFLVAGERMLLIDLESIQVSSTLGAGCARDLARFTLNAEDMGLSQAHFDSFLASYARAMGRKSEEVSKLILPSLAKLRQRHLQKYGSRGHLLI